MHWFTRGYSEEEAHRRREKLERLDRKDGQHYEVIPFEELVVRVINER